MQQADGKSGVNIIVYYSNFIFGTFHPHIDGSPIWVMENLIAINREGLLYSVGSGCINFFGAFPAFFLIETVGRRSLLLCTFPYLAVFHFITMIGFIISLTAYNKIGASVSLLGMYLFDVFYSFGEGPVPFVYASESMTFYYREDMMALVVSINWFFNWLVADSGPAMFSKLKAIGTFAFYGTMCIVI